MERRIANPEGLPPLIKTEKPAVISLEAIRRFATEFPEVEEAEHFRFHQPIFKVRGKPFAGVERGEVAAVFSISQQAAATLVAENRRRTRRSGARALRGASSAYGSTLPWSRRSGPWSSSSRPGEPRLLDEW